MLLAVNAGNTNINFAVFDGQEPAAIWRISTDPERTSEEYARLINESAEQAGVSLSGITGFALCSVVPRATESLLQFAREALKIDNPFALTASSVVGLKIRYNPPTDLGADRIANALAAHALYTGPVIAVDLGTATTFDAVSTEGEYLGGAIAPGVETSAEAMVSRTAQLRAVPLAAPPRAIGSSTVECLQSGIIYGFAGQVDGIVNRFKREMGGEARVIATGGLAEVIAPHSQTIEEVRPLLTLEGLRIAYDRAKSEG